MAETRSKAFAGASLGSWYAPNITSDPISGIGGWSNAELVRYLKSGAVPGKGQAGGGMAEAVENSLQFLRDDDLNAIAVFMKTIPAVRHPAQTQPAFTYAASSNLEAELRGTSKQDSNKAIVGGAALFSAYCASCHQPTGVGTHDQNYPSLSRNSATGGLNADNMISAILFGVDRTVGGQHVLMPRFDQTSFVASLSDEQIAEISNYVAQQFGNPQIHVTTTDVSTVRAGGPTPLLALVSTYMPHFLIVSAMIIAAILFGLVRRRRDGKIRSMHA
jgi:mono/diheme cytochrome c family protein